ncbi:MAG: single-stranded-DNA-specific exonuclease RecJ [Candidatus Gracilibacteria bacterium]|nr:single-stranded-DNA-specific exonuclease RecJ [Candidatus Gracilibacteria bacterium]
MKQTTILGNILDYDENLVYEDIEDILSSRFESDLDFNGTIDDLYDPYLLADMGKAVERIKEAVEAKERIVIFGDYDVDGVTSTSILVHFFKKIGANISYRLPHRVEDGYGLKSYFIDELKEKGVSLVITVDCGTRDIEVIKYAKSIGVDVIITDHHAVPEIIPEEAVAIINPKRTDCPYPFKHLSGAGVAYKLMMALAHEYFSDEDYKNYIRESIDIAAIGTVADCMSLTGENRIIVKEGLKQLKNTRSKGIRSIISEKIHTDLDADVFGFLIGPRLNAAGRMDTPYKALNLILNNSDSLQETIDEIEYLNEKRKVLTKDFVAEALDFVNPENNIIFFESSEIEHGIIGIVAGRLTENFFKPSIVLKEEEGKYVASCRSPEYFNIVELLEEFKGEFLAFGGHKQAAGFSIEKSRFDNFKKNVLAKVNSLDFSQNKKTMTVDKIIEPLDISFTLLDKINKYKPFGIGNKKPVLMIKNFEYDKIDFLGTTGEHIKITNKYGFNIVGFGFGKYRDDLKSKKSLDIIFDIQENNWNNKKNLQLQIIDISL